MRWEGAGRVGAGEVWDEEGIGWDGETVGVGWEG